MHRNWKAVPTVAIPAVVTAGLLLGPNVAAQQPPPRTLVLKELEKGATFTHVRNTKASSPRANSQGDLIVFANRLANASGKVVGKLQASCTTTTGARDFRKSLTVCNGVASLRDGTLTLQAISSPGVATTRGAITGGTGAYANARGVFVSREGQHGSRDTIELAE